jgi:hypothetical protein
MNDIQRGQAASQILEHPLVIEAFETIESALVDTWKDSLDSSGREEVYYTLKGLERFKTLLETYVTSGKDELALKEKYGE